MNRAELAHRLKPALDAFGEQLVDLLYSQLVEHVELARIAAIDTFDAALESIRQGGETVDTPASRPVRKARRAKVRARASAAALARAGSSPAPDTSTTPADRDSDEAVASTPAPSPVFTPAALDAHRARQSAVKARAEQREAEKKAEREKRSQKFKRPRAQRSADPDVQRLAPGYVSTFEF